MLSDDVSVLADTSLSVDVLPDRIAGANLKQVILFLDACRNDPERSKGEGDRVALL